MSLVLEDNLDTLKHIAQDYVFPAATSQGLTFGLAKRELFAAMAMQGLLAGPVTIQPKSNGKRRPLVN